MAQYKQMKKMDAEYEAELKTLETAIDSHTKDNRDKRKALQEQGNTLAHQMEFLGKSTAEAHAAMQQLYANAEQNLALAAYAETWEWRETTSKSDQ